MDINLLKLFIPAILSFLIGIFITPFLSSFFYKYKLWKKVSRKENPDKMSKNFQIIHNEKEEIRTPRVGGIVIWGSIMLAMAVIFIVFILFPNDITSKLEFVSRNQTFLPLFALFVGAFIGLVEDLLEIKGTGAFAHGLSGKKIIAIVAFLGLVMGWWYFDKLGIDYINVPITHSQIHLGFLFIPFFILVTLGTFSSRVIDGVDGLSGGVLATIFTSYAIISIIQNQLDLAAFCATVTGAILAFLWFNVPPARFYMGETGMLALTLSLSAVAFLTKQVLLLLVIGFPLVATSLSSFIQIWSKKIFGPEKGKIFKIAPLHHHFEAIGWSRSKITMRYWIFSVICATVGVVLAII